MYRHQSGEFECWQANIAETSLKVRLTTFELWQLNCKWELFVNFFFGLSRKNPESWTHKHFRYVVSEFVLSQARESLNPAGYGRKLRMRWKLMTSSRPRQLNMRWVKVRLRWLWTLWSVKSNQPPVDSTGRIVCGKCSCFFECIGKQKSVISNTWSILLRNASNTEEGSLDRINN